MNRVVETVIIYMKQKIEIKPLLVALVASIVTIVSFAENIPVGTWRTHFNYANTKQVFATQDRIYASSQLGVFYQDINDKSIQVVTKANGLSDVEISALDYDIEWDLLFIGYTNGNLDIVHDGRVTNLDDYKNSDIIATKNIVNTFFYDGFYYLVAQAGIVKIEASNLEVKEYMDAIGPNASEIQIVAAELWRDTLYLVTADELLRAPLNQNLNLLDFNNWTRTDNSQNLAGLEATKINLFSYAGENVYLWNQGSWDDFQTFTKPVRRLKYSGDHLWILRQDTLIRVNVELNTTQVPFPNFTPNDVVTVDQEMWVATESNGLVNIDHSENTILPSGPANNEIVRLKNINNNLYALSPYWNANFQPIEQRFVSQFSASGWQIDTSALSNYSDITANNELFFSSFNDGILNTSTSELISAENSPFSNNSGRTLISAIATDPQGDLWVTDNSSPNFLYKLNQNQEWETFLLPALGTRVVEEIIVDEFNNIWLRHHPDVGGAVVFNPSSQATLVLNRSTLEIAGDGFTSIAFDDEYQIWLATGAGLFNLFLDPFSLEVFEVFQPIFENRILLEDQSITSLEIDAGNRKWIGTEEGLWLLDETQDKVFYQFTDENSPLPSVNIFDTQIIPATGEIFIATDKGLVSFRSDATSSRASHSQVDIFPNPILPGYTGSIGIRGLVRNASLKITTPNGNLVKTIRGYGGGASWDGTNTINQSVNTGIYLLFSTSSDGIETYVGKIAVIR